MIVVWMCLFHNICDVGRRSFEESQELLRRSSAEKNASPSTSGTSPFPFPTTVDGGGAAHAGNSSSDGTNAIGVGAEGGRAGTALSVEVRRALLSSTFEHVLGGGLRELVRDVERAVARCTSRLVGLATVGHGYKRGRKAQVDTNVGRRSFHARVFQRRRRAIVRIGGSFLSCFFCVSEPCRGDARNHCFSSLDTSGRSGSSWPRDWPRDSTLLLCLRFLRGMQIGWDFPTRTLLYLVCTILNDDVFHRAHPTTLTGMIFSSIVAFMWSNNVSEYCILLHRSEVPFNHPPCRFFFFCRTRAADKNAVGMRTHARKWVSRTW